MTIKAIVTDIEGTTSSISFVKDVLFPYAHKYMPVFIKEHEDDIEDFLNDVRKEENNENLTLEEVIEVLQRYIDEDQKVTALKAIQGMIWQAGYEAGELHGHIYEDALDGLKRWENGGIDLYIYSSGSIAAQKLLFGNTEVGDLNPLFKGYFDTTTGPKLEKDSYEKIIREIGLPADQILFLSDNTQEIEAASEAGMCVIVLDRDGVLKDQDKFPMVKTFDDIDPLEKAA